MYLRLKKSKITDWWISRESQKMAFVNILSGDTLSGNFLVVGYLDKSNKILATSTNYVVRITEKGAITAQGTFYPFEEAHELYLQFLIEANKENTLIAYNWDFVDNTKQEIVADIIDKGAIKKGVVFDFISNEKDVMLSGYSKRLESNIVITTFSKRNVCVIIGIPESVKLDIFNTSFALYKESEQRVKNIKKIFTENVNKKIKVKIVK